MEDISNSDIQSLHFNTMSNVNETTLTLSNEQINKILYDIFKCPICLATIENPVTLECCLHRFCKSCLSKHLRPDVTGQKKLCPMCKQYTNHRKLRYECHICRYC